MAKLASEVRTLDLGIWTDTAGVEQHVFVDVFPEKLQHLIAKARKSAKGETRVGSGGFRVRVHARVIS